MQLKGSTRAQPMCSSHTGCAEGHWSLPTKDNGFYAVLHVSNKKRNVIDMAHAGTPGKCPPSNVPCPRLMVEELQVGTAGGANTRWEGFGSAASAAGSISGLAHQTPKHKQSRPVPLWVK